MNFVDHHIVRCGLVCVHTCEMPCRIKFAIQIGLPRGGYYPISKMGQLQYTHTGQFDRVLRRLDGEDHVSPGHRKIAVGALRNLCHKIYHIGDA